MNHADRKSRLEFWKIPKLSESEFKIIQKIVYDKVGINLSDHKKRLVVSRLTKRLRALEINTFKKYFDLIRQDNLEMQNAINLITTNETYFFREQVHFNFLVEHVFPQYEKYSSLHIWSAASSTGEEAYSIAMELAEYFGIGARWKITGTDVNVEVIEKAREAMYQVREKDNIPREYLKKYCLKGVRSKEGFLLIDPALKHHVNFDVLNLIEPWPDGFGDFDIVFLRNVMIYFDRINKERLIQRISKKIKVGGYLFVGQSETLNNLTDQFEIVAPSTYRRKK